MLKDLLKFKKQPTTKVQTVKGEDKSILYIPHLFVTAALSEESTFSKSVVIK